MNPKRLLHGLALAFLCVLNLPSARGEIIYNNSSERKAPYRFVETRYEFGEEIILAGSPAGSWVLTNFQYEFFAEGPDFVQGHVTVKLRLYKNDGPSGKPGTKFYESDPRRVPVTKPAGAVFEYFGLSIPAPRSFTYAIEFTGVTSASSVKVQSGGLDLYGVPTIGQTYDDYWSRSGAGGTWELRGPTADEPDINFGCRVSGVYSGAPTITQQPESVFAYAQETVAFNVIVIGTAPLTYQWLKNGLPIAGAPNSATFTLNGVTVADAGMYSVKISNGLGSVTSVEAQLTIPSDLPGLRIKVRPPNVVAISWPVAFGSPWVLQETSSFDPPIVWTTSPASVAVVGGRFSVSVSSSTGQKFFRLFNP